MQYTLLTLAYLIPFSLSSASHKHQKHEDFKQVEGKNVSSLFKRDGTCSFPSGDGLVAVQKSGKNAGWAMHSDQTCSYGSWCPYACPAGQLMAQWDPEVTSYTYPGSQYGGLYCDEDGNLQEKRSGDSYCYDGKGTVIAKNSCGSNVAFCQTVLPGNEEMLIPTDVSNSGQSTLAVPGTEYWAGTAAHYYINPPGVSTDDGCQWGSTSNPWGNWAPYVAGANMDDSKNTFVKIGWNPVYLEDSSPYKSTKPEFGIKITCDNEDDCVGLPCYIDPSEQDVNGVGGSSSSGAGGGNFCVVTAKNGAKANVEVFEAGSNSKVKRHAHGHAGGINHQEVVTTVSTVFKTMTA